LVIIDAFLLAGPIEAQACLAKTVSLCLVYPETSCDIEVGTVGVGEAAGIAMVHLAEGAVRHMVLKLGELGGSPFLLGFGGFHGLAVAAGVYVYGGGEGGYGYMAGSAGA